MNIQQKLTGVQCKLKAPKNQFNSFGKYHYRSCEDILEAAKPLLKEADLSLTLTDKIEFIGDRFYLVATAILSDGENEIITTAYAREEEAKKGMDGAQVTGAASSYARKYCLNGLFLIDDTKDGDSTNQGDKTPEKPQQSAQKKPTREDIINASMRYAKVLDYDLVEMQNYFDEHEGNAIIERYLALKNEYEKREEVK